MKQYLSLFMVTALSLVLFQAFAVTNDALPTTQKVDEVWNANYEYGSKRKDAFVQIIKDIGTYAPCCGQPCAI